MKTITELAQEYLGVFTPKPRKTASRTATVGTLYLATPEALEAYTQAVLAQHGIGAAMATELRAIADTRTLEEIAAQLRGDDLARLRARIDQNAQHRLGGGA